MVFNRMTYFEIIDYILIKYFKYYLYCFSGIALIGFCCLEYFVNLFFQIIFYQYYSLFVLVHFYFVCLLYYCYLYITINLQSYFYIYLYFYLLNFK